LQASAASRLQIVAAVGRNASKTQKDTKIEGTNSLKSSRINKSDKKRTQNELVFERKKGRTKRRMGPKIDELR
jgi:hypothetical protein